MNEPSPGPVDPPRRAAAFHTTRWSILRAAAGTGDAAQQALDDLARAYRYPLYAFARRLGADADLADDLVQGFFARLLERADLANLRPENGRFRSFLRVAFRNHVNGERARERAERRGGGRVRSLEFDTRFAQEPGHAETPEALFDRAFAQATVEHAATLLEQDYAARGQQQVFAALMPVVVGGAEDGYRALGARLGLSEVAVKVAVHRLRRRFGEQLRALLGGTVERPQDVDDELRALRAAFAAS